MYRIVLIAKNDKAVESLKKFGDELVMAANSSGKEINIIISDKDELEFEIIEPHVD